MTTTLISNNIPYTFGQQTNQAIGKLIGLNTQLERLKDAIATASASYEGVAGTQFETSSTGGIGQSNNLFGVVPNDTPGEQGTAYAYAMGRLTEEWAAFWTVASPFIEQLDNGQNTM